MDADITFSAAARASSVSGTGTKLCMRFCALTV